MANPGIDTIGLRRWLRWWGRLDGLSKNVRGSWLRVLSFHGELGDRPSLAIVEKLEIFFGEIADSVPP